MLLTFFCLALSTIYNICSWNEENIIIPVHFQKYLVFYNEGESGVAARLYRIDSTESDSSGAERNDILRGMD